MAAAMSLAALAPTWYWIGVGRALPILWAEVLPRTAATLGATGILLAGGGAIWYPVLLTVAMIAGPGVIYCAHRGLGARPASTGPSWSTCCGGTRPPWSRRPRPASTTPWP